MESIGLAHIKGNQRQKLVGIGSADRSVLVWPRISAYAYQCPIRSVMKSQAYQWGETARSAQQRDDRALTRAISPAKRSTVATIRNNQRPYHWKRHNCQRRYVLKYLHLGLNSRAQLALNSERELALNSERELALNSRAQLAPNGRAQLALRSEAHLRPGGRQHKHVGTLSVGDRGRIALARVGSHTRQLASLKLGRIAPVSKWNQHATRGLLLRPPPVGDT
jgi:hypothetical protein